MCHHTCTEAGSNSPCGTGDTSSHNTRSFNSGNHSTCSHHTGACTNCAGSPCQAFL